MINTSTVAQNPHQAQTGEEWFEVFITGKGLPHNLVFLSTKVIRKASVPINSGVMNGRLFDENGSQELQTYHLHKINVPIVKGSTYVIYTPKIFA